MLSLNFDGQVKMGPGISLAPEERAFLENHFVGYDPRTRRKHRNFSAFLSARAVLMGDVRGSKVGEAVQDRFFELFGKGPCCLLLEGFYTDQKIEREVLPEWPSLPESVAVFGSDYREKVPYAVAAEHRKVIWYISDLYRRKRLGVERRLIEINGLFAGLISRGEATINHGALCFSAQIDAMIQERFGYLFHEAEVYDQKIESEKKRLKGIFTALTTTCLLKQSNEALADMMSRVALWYGKVFAVWGMAHAQLGENICEKLDAEDISSFVLLPNERLLNEIREEMLWQRAQVPLVKFSIRVGSGSAEEVSFPASLSSVFKGSIQQILRFPGVDPLVLDAARIRELCQGRERVTVPAHTPIHLLKVLTEDIFKWEDRPAGYDEERGDKMQKMLKMPFLAAGIQLKRVEGGEPAVDFESHEPICRIVSGQPIVFHIDERGPLITTVQRLVNALLLKEGNSLSLFPNQRLLFTDISRGELGTIARDPEKLAKRWLNHQTGWAYQFIFDRRFEVRFALIDNQVALLLYGEKGLTLQIHTSSFLHTASAAPI